MGTKELKEIIKQARTAGRTALSEFESKRILEEIGLPTTTPHLARTSSEAAAAARRIGFPVVVKVASPDVSHKSDVGGVVLNLTSESDVEKAFAQIKEQLARNAAQARFDGVTVQKMARPGVELLAGIVRDARFGPMVMVGMGGVFTEVLQDTALRLAPIDAAVARGMLAELRGGELLRGVRGRRAADAGAISSLLVRLSELAAGSPEIEEMDLNPVAVYEDGLMVLDARVKLATADGQQPRPTSSARIENLRRAFNPKTIAVIGDKRMGGYMWLRAESKFTGKLYSVQIDPNEIPGIEAMGVTNFKSLAEIGEPIDHAITAVPRQVAPRILKDCIDTGVRSVTFFTSGFSETAEELGKKLEADLRGLAATSDIALIGPNCMGLYSPAVGLCNFPEEKVGERGDVCFISQSGTHCINFAMQAADRAIKINKAASIGNAIVLEPADYIDVMAEDPDTRVLGMYIEGGGNGRRLFESISRAAARYPVVVWKGGATEAGARATFSHTGSLATPQKVWKAAMLQSGAVEVDSLDSMLDAIELFSRGRKVTGRRLGLVAMTGGQSVVITDTFSRAGLEIPTLSPASYEELKQFFNVIGGSYRNPLDAGQTIGMGHHQGNLERIMSILEHDPVIDTIVLEISTGLQAARWDRHEDQLTTMLDRFAEFNNSSKKPFAVILHPSHLEAIVARAKRLARDRGLVVFDTFERAASAFSVAADYWVRRQASEEGARA